MRGRAETSDRRKGWKLERRLIKARERGVDFFWSMLMVSKSKGCMSLRSSNRSRQGHLGKR